MGVYGITGLVLFVSAIYGSNLVMRTIAQPQTVSVLENDTSPPAEPVEVNVPAVQHDPTQGAVEHCSEVDCNSNEMQPVWVEALKRCVCIRTRDK